MSEPVQFDVTVVNGHYCEVLRKEDSDASR